MPWLQNPASGIFPQQPTCCTSKLNPRSRKIPAHRGRRCEHRMQTEDLLRLRWAASDWNACILTVREAKVGEARRIPMNSTVKGLFSNIQKLANFAAQDRIFPLEARCLRRVFDKAVNASGLAPFKFHDCRHSFASRLAMQGANDRTFAFLCAAPS